ncbi:MAG: transporter, partial [Cyanobacteriota bacterium]
GLLLRRWKPECGNRWAATVQSIAFWVSMLMVGLLLLMVAPQLLGFVRANAMAIPAMALMTVIALAMGYGLAGDGPRERITTALVTSMRNPGLALLFAVTHGQHIQGVKLAIVTYLLVTILTSIPFLRWMRTQPAN